MPDAPYSVVIAAGTFADATPEQRRAGSRARFRIASIATPAEIRLATADADALVVTNNPLTADHIAALGDNVRLIARAGIGLDAIDLEAARTRGLAVYHVPDYATAEVATHAVAMLLAVARKLVAGNRIARERWREWDELKPVGALTEQTFGLVGYGRIGRAVAARVAPLVRLVQAYDPVAAIDGDAAESPSLDDLLATSDLVSLHLPLTDGTRGLIGARELGLMKQGAIIVNVSRGGLIDEPALADALADGRIAGAALDVASAEPPPADWPLYRSPNLLLSPHVGWYSEGAEVRLRETVADAVVAFLGGSRPSAGRVAVEPAAA